ncbi:MAG: signal recognition particle-docking protein FtsY [Candidatus Nanoarchaeia archaeon]|nr:signal recognition particle-docking protein FtsY [Candidatus Nanoarchaeia archaeon]MDD5358467.1 signal recognition particle-docking protein FtsY [Candidatus Nanoarchaeia archaeon]MDD5588981.1 signal recognition particle-docking protein FtsY [Candidatus Nanoarchaeia archaeon]
MFNKLKEKLKNWTQKLSQKAEEEAEEEIKEKVREELEETKKSEKELKREEKEEKEQKKKEKKDAKEKKRQEKREEKEKKIVLKEEETEEEKKKGIFQKFGEKISKVKISEKEFDVYGEELEMLLLENNVALEVAEKIVRDLKKKIVNEELLKKEIESEINESFKDIIRDILIEPPNLAVEIKDKFLSSNEPYVILFCGINGTGKTTTIAKIAENLKHREISCVIAAGDTFRAASIEQIKTHGERIGVKVIAHDYGSDPASVGFDAIQYAKKNKINCVLIDTAGRMHTQKNLIREMEKIVKVCKPDKKVFVGESITGNDAIEQVRSFDEAIGIDGIVLTKADIDEKGGTALSVGYVTKKPILYLGTGQEYNKIEPFDKEKFIERLGL